MDRRKPCMGAVGCLFLLLAVPQLASADRIRLTDGFLEITSAEQGLVEVFGEQGFSLLADIDVSQGRFDPWTQCNHMSACAPGGWRSPARRPRRERSAQAVHHLVEHLASRPHAFERQGRQRLVDQIEHRDEILFVRLHVEHPRRELPAA